MVDTTVTNAGVERPSRAPRALRLGVVVLYRGGPCAPEPRRVDAALTLGRADDAGIVLEDPSVSRNHARLAPTSDGVFVTDLRSHNGTFVDGQRVTQPDVHAPFGAVVRVGSTVLLVVRDVTPFETRDDVTSPSLVGGPAMAEVRQRIASVASSHLPVLIVGESGTGRELVARAIHEASGRSGPLIGLDCAAVAEELLESELFGEREGALAGATDARPGLFLAAHQGTLLLGELGELPLPLQAKLLRVLQTGEIRVGDGSSVDVRVVGATSRDLFAMAEEGMFRSDLLDRVAAAQIRIPPLRERRDDLAPLTAHFLKEEAIGITAEAFEALLLREYPGNVRELRNVLRVGAANARANRSSTIAPGDLPARAEGVSTTRPEGELGIRKRLELALSTHGGDVAAAAKSLLMSRTTLDDTLRRLKIEPTRFRRG